MHYCETFVICSISTACLLCIQVLDYLAIAVHELASMSERRIDRLMNPGNTEKIVSQYFTLEFEIFSIQVNHFFVHSSLFCYVSAYSDLPAFLVQQGGLNSGFMLAHCTAAALGWKYFIFIQT